MVIVAWRAAPELDATLKLTVPFPLPLAPDVIMIQEALGVALQGQVLGLLPGFAVTETVPVPPPAGRSVYVEPRVKVQGEEGQQLKLTVLLFKPTFVALIVP
jgi:hypothetical protein